jgi:hypothetical protein
MIASTAIRYRILIALNRIFGIPEGSVLPLWLRGLRWLLFPLDSFYWNMRKTRGYQFETDTWLINEIQYSGEMLFQLSKINNGVFRIISDGKTVTMRRIDDSSR